MSPPESHDKTVFDESSSETSDPLVGVVLDERYRIEEKLGQGGMGAVYRAQHVMMQKTVAIKVLHHEMTGLKEIVKRFAREAIAAGSIEHPNVAAATDFGELGDGSYYLALEFVPGRSLSALLKEVGRLDEDRALVITRQVASALAGAHAVGIVHRDLKPDNVMLVEKAGMSDFVKVLDFGIAKVAADGDSKLTQTGAVFGTPQYMSPEQAQGKPVDGRADLYCLGLLLHEMLSGARTFECPEIAGLLVKQMMEPPPELPADISAETRQLVKELLAKDPDERPSNAATLVTRVDGILATSTPTSFGETSARPISSRPPSATSVVGQRLSQGLERARTLWASIEPDVERTGRRLMKLGRRKIAGRVPVWAAAAALVGLIVLLSSLGSEEEPAAERAKAAVPTETTDREPSESDEAPEEDDTEEAFADRPTDPELLKVIAAAERGSQPALYALSQRDPDDRTTEEWKALAEGYLHRREIEKALEAYAVALERSPRVANDKTMLAGLRYFATRDSTYKQVLDFAAEHMGERGADLLFHVWASTSRKTPATERAWELLESDEVREHMSEPLRIALSLRAAESCEEAKALLPKAVAVADERSLLRLRMFDRQTDCDRFKDECYPCMEGSKELADALVQVQMRNAPRFEVRRRWR